MTREEIIQSIKDKEERIKELQKPISALNDEIRGLNQTLIDMSPFKLGDKVAVTERNNKTTICFISSININSDNEYHYNFRAMKKDGSMSSKSAGVCFWRVKDIEPV